jgi:hypothetical protein
VFLPFCVAFLFADLDLLLLSTPPSPFSMNAVYAVL